MILVRCFLCRQLHGGQFVGVEEVEGGVGVGGIPAIRYGGRRAIRFPTAMVARGKKGAGAGRVGVGVRGEGAGVYGSNGVVGIASVIAATW